MSNVDLSGDPRIFAADADGYWLVCTIDGVRAVSPLYGVEDVNAGGYIAFTTGEEVAERIAAALRNATR